MPSSARYNSPVMLEERRDEASGGRCYLIGSIKSFSYATLFLLWNMIKPRQSLKTCWKNIPLRKKKKKPSRPPWGF